MSTPSEVVDEVQSAEEAEAAPGLELVGAVGADHHFARAEGDVTGETEACAELNREAELTRVDRPEPIAEAIAGGRRTGANTRVVEHAGEVPDVERRDVASEAEAVAEGDPSPPPHRRLDLVRGEAATHGTQLEGKLEAVAHGDSPLRSGDRHVGRDAGRRSVLVPRKGPETEGAGAPTDDAPATRRRAAVLDGRDLARPEPAEGHGKDGLDTADLAPMISDDRLERHDLTADLREVGGVAGAGRFARPVDEDAERRARDTRLRLRTPIRNHLHGAEVPDLRLERGQARLVIAHHALNLGVRGHEHPAAGKDRGAEPPRREALARTPEGAGRRHDTVARRASAPGRLKTAAAGTAGLPHQHSAPRPTIQAGRAETVGESDRARARRHLAARRVGLPLEARVSLTGDGGELRAQRGELDALPAAGQNGPPRRLLRPPRKVGAGGGLRRGLTRQAAGQNDPLLTGGLARRRHAAGAAGQRLGRGRGADGAVGGGARVGLLSRRGVGVDERDGQHGRREKHNLLHRDLLEGNCTPLVFFLTDSGRTEIPYSHHERRTILKPSHAHL